MKVIGTKHHDVLVGSPAPFSDVIRGKGGDDVIIGNGGVDKLYGGKGADTFIFNLENAPDGIAKIKDFEEGKDTIVIVPNEPMTHFPPVYDDVTGIASVRIGEDIWQPVAKLTAGLTVAPPDLILMF
jgi:hypothetical protein